MSAPVAIAEQDRRFALAREALRSRADEALSARAVGGTWPRQLAIAAQTWLAVRFDAIFGPAIASTTRGGGST
jgi:hypothetical protein